MVRLILEEEVAALRGAHDDRTVRCLVDLAMPCNMRCVGCDGRPEATPLSDDAAKALAADAAARIDGASALAMAIYGGEPLLDPGRLVTLVSRVRRACEERGAAFSAHLITNGTLLAEARPRHLAQSGFRTFQVTLDGPRRLNDARRRLLDGSGTWRKVVEGLRRARDHAAIVVRAPADGLAPVEELLDALDAEGLLDGGSLAVYVARAATYQDQARDLLRLPALLVAPRLTTFPSMTT
jgi:uncharacterized protein